MTYCYILNVYSKYVAAGKLNVLCLPVAQGCFGFFFVVKACPWWIMTDWQNEVLDRADGDLLSFLIFIFRFIMR